MKTAWQCCQAQMRMPSGVMALGSFSGPAVSHFAWSFISYMGCNGVKSPVHVELLHSALCRYSVGT